MLELLGAKLLLDVTEAVIDTVSAEDIKRKAKSIVDNQKRAIKDPCSVFDADDER